MTSEELKALKKIAAFCRKEGIKTFEGYGVVLEFGEKPTKSRTKKAPTEKVQVAPTLIPDENPDDLSSQLTEEQLLFWSIGEDPAQPKSEN